MSHGRYTSWFKLAFLSSIFAFTNAESKVVRTSAYSNYQAALNVCQPGDVLLIDGGTKSPMKDPPSDLQIIGGAATWVFTKDIEKLVFFNHSGQYTQLSGTLKHSMFLPGGNNSRFTSLDSCFFRPGELYGWWNKGPRMEVDGFMRSTSIIDMRTGNTSSNDRWEIGHEATMRINATDRVGNGNGSFIGFWLCWGQTDWTNLHILNGAGITVADFNSEYPTWSDPMVQIDNGFGNVITGFTPGGYEPTSSNGNEVKLSDGTTAYSRIAFRNGLWRVAGMGNAIVGGISYKSFRSMVTTWPVHDLNLRDPYFTRWNANRSIGLNFAQAMGTLGVNGTEWVTWSNAPNQNGYLVSAAASCTTFFADGSGNALTAGLKPKSLRQMPTTMKPYFPRLPKLRAGLGEDMTGKDGSAILSALNSGKTVYLGTGTYKIPGTIRRGAVYGAGMDETVLEFAGGRAFEDTDAKASPAAYNLTIKGGKVGYAQTRNFNVMDLANVRFKDQSLCGITLGNAQNVFLGNLEFDNAGAGILTCQDGTPCGESMSTTSTHSMIDKVLVYGSTFRNMTSGSALGVANNGYSAWYGCTFENLENGIRVWRTKGGGGKSNGYHVRGCDFVNVDKAVDISGSYEIDHCTVKSNKAGAVGFTGGILAATQSRLEGVSMAIEAPGDAVVSHVIADGEIKFSSSTWIGASKFSNKNASNGVHLGDADLSGFVDNSPLKPDRTPPSVPGNVKVSGKTITWEPSMDAESGIIAYIVELDGKEIHRTGYSYNLDPTQNPKDKPVTGFRHVTSYTDNSGAAGSNYKVVAVNGALMRSDGNMAEIRRWPNSWIADKGVAHVPSGELTGIAAVQYWSPGEVTSSLARPWNHERRIHSGQLLTGQGVLLHGPQGSYRLDGRLQQPAR